MSSIKSRRRSSDRSNPALPASVSNMMVCKHSFCLLLISSECRQPTVVSSTVETFSHQIVLKLGCSLERKQFVRFRKSRWSLGWNESKHDLTNWSWPMNLTLFALGKFTYCFLELTWESNTWLLSSNNQGTLSISSSSRAIHHGSSSSYQKPRCSRQWTEAFKQCGWVLGRSSLQAACKSCSR
jgi:hypothetical protein